MTNSTGPGPEEILKGYNSYSFKQDDGEIGEAYDSESVKELMASYASLREREAAIGFAEWKDYNYVNYQMQEGKYYHKRDLLKHISEATVFTTAQVYELFVHHKNIGIQASR